jgi:trehalose/maltose transport system permease protein
MTESPLSGSPAAGMRRRRGPRRPGWRRRGRTLQTRQRRTAWVFLFPSLVVLVLVALWPLVETIYQSLTDEKLATLTPARFVGLDNYKELLGNDPIFGSAVWTTLKFTVVTVAIELVLGMIVALVVHAEFRARGLTRTAMLIPWAVPTVVSAQMWKWMFSGQGGVINDLLVNKLGIVSSSVPWLAEPTTAFIAVCAVDVWKTTPFVALLLLAGLQVIPREIYDAGKVDGATAWRQFTSLTLPLLRPAILVVLIFRTLDALRVFDVFYVMLGSSGTTQTLATYAQQHIVYFSDVGYGSAVSVLIFLIIGIFVVAYATAMKTEEER